MHKTLLIGAGLVLLSAVPALACTDISSKTVALTGCVDGEWQAGTGTGAQEFVYTTADQAYGLMVITEKDAFAATQFHDAIIANAIAGVGGKKEDVTVISERVENINDKPFNVLQYDVNTGGQKILFQNFYYSQPGFGSVQILSYSLDTDAVASSYKAGVFTSSVKLSK